MNQMIIHQQLALTNMQTRQEIKDEYDKITKPALAKYKKIIEPAWFEYMKIDASAQAEMNRKLQELGGEIITVEGKRYKLIN